MTAQKKLKQLTEFEAAKLTGMSPQLLRWLTQYPPKQGDPRKLAVAKEEQGIVYFEEETLKSFNEWLKQPWPQKDGQRPHIPSGIRKEIVTEANGECAICNSNSETCEAAHLDPVSKSRNNHPENLLWLCRNHHKKYDGGLFGPDDQNAAFVHSFKVVLHRYKVSLWSMQQELSSNLLALLTDCDRLGRQLEAAQTLEQVKAIERIANATFDQISKVAPVSRMDPLYGTLEQLPNEVASVLSVTDRDQNVREKLIRVRSVRTKLVTRQGYSECPLCQGEGLFDSETCPECGGEGSMPRWRADQVDTSQYTSVKCPLCKGELLFDDETCPECGGEGSMPRWRADQVDTSRYTSVKCPLCKGEGLFDDETCPECGGDGSMPRWRADQVDTSLYKDSKCPLCKGKGLFDDETCQECGGEGSMPRWRANQVDTRQYTSVKCPLCKGEGLFDDETCPECGGDGSMPRWRANQVDTSQYTSVKCPLCKGEGLFDDETCPECGGDGSMPRWRADQVDISHYS